MIISAQKANEAAEVLGIELTCLTKKVLGSAYRAKAMECHPDHHGTAKLQQWARVSWAREALRIWIEKHPPVEQPKDITKTGDCRACEGTGRVKVVRQRGSFGKPLTMACVICKGLGTVILEEHDED